VEDLSVYGIHAVTQALQSDNVRELFLLASKKNKKLQPIIELANANQVSVIKLDEKAFSQKAKRGNHQGVFAVLKAAQRFAEGDIPFIFEKNERNIILCLEGVTDPHNLGACLRTAAAFGVSMVIAPKNNSAPVNATVRKVAVGATEIVPYIQVTNLVRVIKQLQELGAWAYGADMDGEKALPEIDFSGHVIMVMGSEGEGLRRLTRESMDGLFAIPMTGAVESLNVSVATAICLYEVAKA